MRADAAAATLTLQPKHKAIDVGRRKWNWEEAIPGGYVDQPIRMKTTKKSKKTMKKGKRNSLWLSDGLTSDLIVVRYDARLQMTSTEIGDSGYSHDNKCYYSDTLRHDTRFLLLNCDREVCRLTDW